MISPFSIIALALILLTLTLTNTTDKYIYLLTIITVILLEMLNKSDSHEKFTSAEEESIVSDIAQVYNNQDTLSVNNLKVLSDLTVSGDTALGSTTATDLSTTTLSTTQNATFNNLDVKDTTYMTNLYVSGSQNICS